VQYIYKKDGPDVICHSVTMDHRQSRLCSSAGFTLVEMVVVIALIGVLLSIAAPQLAAYLEQGRKAKCLSNRYNIEQDERTYYLNNNSASLAIDSRYQCSSGGTYAWLVSDPTAPDYPRIGCSLHYGTTKSQTATAEKYFVYTSSTGKITGYDTSGGSDVIIPSTIGGALVKIIGHAAFMNKNLSSVSIPVGVNSIATNAFHTNNLSSIDIPESVTSIGPNAFLYNNLTNVTIPENVSSIGDSAFAYNSLKSVTILSKDTSFGTYAFSFQDNPEKLIIYGYKDSTAEAYAKQRGYTFVSLP